MFFPKKGIKLSTQKGIKSYLKFRVYAALFVLVLVLVFPKKRNETIYPKRGSMLYGSHKIILPLKHQFHNATLMVTHLTLLNRVRSVQMQTTHLPRANKEKGTYQKEVSVRFFTLMVPFRGGVRGRREVNNW